MDDKDLRALVMDELDYEPEVDASAIGVTVKEGVVSLYGHVNSFFERMAAEDSVRRVRGVRAIANEIEVDLKGDAIVSDDEIALRAARILDWDYLLNTQDFQIRVQRGQIDLEGRTHALFLKHRAKFLLTGLPGVRGVFNHIIVEPPLEKGDIANRISAALSRLAEKEVKDLNIQVLDGKVILRGQVGTLLEKRRIEERRRTHRVSGMWKAI